jgi:NAD(P)-dependent dehydrogenase (short-subunit alcohol dehydrogenase family)
MNGTFAGKVALVAGGTGGLGRAISLALLEAGAAVAVTYRKPEELDALEKATAATGRARLSGHAVDVTDEAAVRRLLDEIVSRHGRLDALVNAVGGYAGGKKLWETDPKVFDQMLLLNLRAGLALCRAAVPVMLMKGHGAIVNVASRSAVVHGPGEAAYATSKAAAVAMIDSLAADLKGTPIRANSVLPSIIDTEANRNAMPKADFTKWPKPEDIARVVLFLCSEDAKLIRGASIPVYGET